MSLSLSILYSLYLLMFRALQFLRKQVGVSAISTCTNVNSGHYYNTRRLMAPSPASSRTWSTSLSPLMRTTKVCLTPSSPLSLISSTQHPIHTHTHIRNSSSSSTIAAAASSSSASSSSASSSLSTPSHSQAEAYTQWKESLPHVREVDYDKNGENQLRVFHASLSPYLSAELRSIVHDGKESHPLSHWGMFQSTTPTAELAADGYDSMHAPPAPFIARMYAGGSIKHLKPVDYTKRLRRVTTVPNVQHKDGRAGDLVFVTLQHDIMYDDVPDDSDVLISETKIYVYLRVDNSRRFDFLHPSSVPPSAEQVCATHGYGAPSWTTNTSASAVDLFRFSAVTMNAHRIHYDTHYVTNVERLPGVVVHGPLTAALAVGYARQFSISSFRHVRAIEFRAISPVFMDEPITLFGFVGEDAAPRRIIGKSAASDENHVQVLLHVGERLAMQVDITFASDGVCIPSTALYHNPKCSKSRATLALLEENNIEATTVLYLEENETPNAVSLAELIKMLGTTPRDLMRKGENVYTELGLADETLTDQQLIDAMVAHPILIERPICVHNGKAAIGRPPESVLNLFD
jgi:arsenate reductase (glutaredoxin)